MTTIKQVLVAKGANVWSIGPSATVFDAIKLMAEKDVGSLLVMDGERLLGIITERHYARDVVLKGKSSPTTAVREIMATPLRCVTPDQSVEECMALMTAHRIRHLPVMKGERVVGIVSIGDLVKSIIDDQGYVISQLQNYIRG